MDPQNPGDFFDPSAQDAAPFAADEVESPFPPGDERNAPPAPDAAAEEPTDVQEYPAQPSAPAPDPYLIAELERVRTHNQALQSDAERRDGERAQAAWHNEQRAMQDFERNRDAALAQGTLEPQQAVDLTKQFFQQQINQRDQALRQHYEQQHQAQFTNGLVQQFQFEQRALHEWTSQIAHKHGLTQDEFDDLQGAHPDKMDRVATRMVRARQNTNQQHANQQFAQRQNSRVDVVGGALGRAGDPRLNPSSKRYDSDYHLDRILEGMS